LRDQRRYLKDEHDLLATSKDEQLGLLQHLAHIAIFVREVWPESTDTEAVVPYCDDSDKDETLLCIDVLRQANHQITIALLGRYFAAVRQARQDTRVDAIREFASAAKAVTAFFALWRGSRIGTQNIDRIYRDLMRVGVAGDGGVGAFRRREEHE